MPAGWDLTGATCSDGSNPASVAVAAGENVTCTFTNTKRGSLTVVKQATGSDATFPFVSQALGNFSLATVNGAAQRSFGNLVPGSLRPERERAGRLAAGQRDLLRRQHAAQRRVEPGEDVTCTFANTQLDTIIVVKRAVGGDGGFTFTSQALGGFILTR